MRKQYIIIISLLITAFSAAAQFTPAKTKVKAKPVTDSAGAAMCGCIMSNKDSLVSLNNLYAILDNCMKENSAGRIEQLLNEYGFIQTDDRKARANAIRAVGNKLGKKVADECPGLKEIIANLTANENKKISLN
jgi:hypothetical protein